MHPLHELRLMGTGLSVPRNLARSQRMSTTAEKGVLRILTWNSVECAVRVETLRRAPNKDSRARIVARTYSGKASKKQLVIEIERAVRLENLRQNRQYQQTQWLLDGVNRYPRH